jgi:UDP-GlcNAc3NAcA epimerase
MKIVTVIGARPQFVKAAAVSRALRGVTDIQEVLVHTGQHYDENMSDVFFKELEIPEPRYNLGVGSGPQGQQTGRMLGEIERVLSEEHPDIVVVYGDTNSTLAGALAASKMHIPLAHVEAGLRSFNRAMPEEINRVVTDHVADILFAPTDAGMRNLLREGIDKAKVFLVGDVMYDAAVQVGNDGAEQTLEQCGIESGEYVLATIHRAENTDASDRLQHIFAGLKEVARRIPVLVPLHPRTRAALQRDGLFQCNDADLRLIAPVGYRDMMHLEHHAALIATDSGGVQKEAFFHRVKCVTLRDETEWVELVQMGWNRLVPPESAEAVRNGITRSLETEEPADVSEELYGGGWAADRIVDILVRKGKESPGLCKTNYTWTMATSRSVQDKRRGRDGN